MKIRKGFVSNSSSSSFVIIGNSPDELEKLRGMFRGTVLVVDRSFGNYEFGWDFEKYKDFGSKVIFCYIQAKYMTIKRLVKENASSSWLEMLNKVLMEKLELSSIDWKIDVEEYGSDNYSYIDHQSASYEGDCIDMFDDEQSLINFLFSSGSSIRTGNDNY